MKTWMTGLLIQAFCMLTAVAESFPVDFSSVANMGFADAAAGDPEAQARYERMLAARRENYHRKKQAEAEAAQVS